MRRATAALASAGTSAIVGKASPGAAASKTLPAITRCFTGTLSEIKAKGLATFNGGVPHASAAKSCLS
ncbi:hypothetical protein GA0061100_110108 [Rhizobium hainanense]|uniref:Uncharacterized protein n=1 Tax=Rhizobium hainanense TaxID=52131 RepID=A0A1C3W2E8_9HYPH|nr:hypothetical protein GA0061100_110108 [Rhizobium hainanense]